MFSPGEVIALISAIIWATGVLMYRIALRELSPVQLALIRSVSAALVLTLPAIALKASPFSGFDAVDLFLISLSAVFLLVGDISYFRCVGTSGIWIATPLSSAYPLFVAAIAYAWLGEGLAATQMLGIVLIVSGILALTIKPPPSGGEGDQARRGAIRGLVAALAWAWSLVTLRVVLIQGDILQGLSTRMLLVMVFMGSAMATFGRSGGRSRKHVSRPAMVLGFVSGGWSIGLGGWLFFYSMGLIGTAKATAISATYPLFAGIFGTLLLGERVNLYKVIGAVLVVVGLALLV